MREWTTVAMKELAREMAVKAAAMEEKARRKRRGRPAAVLGDGRPAKGERRRLTPYLHDFLVL